MERLIILDDGSDCNTYNKPIDVFIAIFLAFGLLVSYLPQVNFKNIFLFFIYRVKINIK